MLAHLIIFALAQASSPFLDAFDRVSPQVASDRVTQCGAGKVTLRSDQALDSDVLVITAVSALDDQQLACIDHAASFYDVELPSTIQPRFRALREARLNAIMVAEARRWLSAHKLLDRLPKYEQGVTDDALFARQIEQICNAKGALASVYGPHAVSPDWVKGRMNKRGFDDGPFTCLTNATWATGYELGFIGNERFTP